MSKKEQDSSKEKKAPAKADPKANDAKAKIKQAEKAGGKAGPAKEKKPAGEAFKTGWAKFKKFWKDFRGELKKIVWPDGRTVLKNTGIVLITVLVIGVLIWVLDFGLVQGVRGLRTLAERRGESQTQQAPGTSDDDFDAAAWLAEQEALAPTEAPAETPTEATTEAAAE